MDLSTKAYRAASQKRVAFARRNSSKTGQFFSPIAALPALSSQAVADLQFARSQIAHQPQSADSSTCIAAQIHNEPAATVESCNSPIDVFGDIDSDCAGKHRHFEQADLVGEHLRVNRLRRGYGMFLGLRHGQLKA